MKWKAKYIEWLDSPYTPFDMKTELKQSNEASLKDSFSNHLEFGTGGMRGEIGFGINRMNVMVVRRVTMGLAIFLKERDTKDKNGVVIQFDTRYKSKEFAEVAAATLASQGFLVHLSDEPRPTPLLSYLVREKNALAGIMITASHNPPQYNGYKIYDSKGGQLLPNEANRITEILTTVPSETDIEPADLEKYVETNKVIYYSGDMENNYINSLESFLEKYQSPIRGTNNLSIVYTPLHGTGTSLVLKTLKHFGFNTVEIVEEQATYDGSFETVKTPNPEEAEAFNLGIKKAISVNADIVLATDPDADRIGVVVKSGCNDYQYITGNQLGALLINYLLETNQKNRNKILLKTIVTSDLGANIAKSYGCDVIETLTGFKFIGERINGFNDTIGEKFLLGYEESCGYLIYPISRDKDAIQASLLIAQVASYYKKYSKSLLDVLEELYSKYGFYDDYLHTVSFENDREKKRIEDNIETLYDNPPLHFCDENVYAIENYETGYRRILKNNTCEKLNLPKSGVLKFVLTNDSWFAIRLSGTENKCKIYFSARGTSEKESKKILSEMKNKILNHYF